MDTPPNDHMTLGSQGQSRRRGTYSIASYKTELKDGVVYPWTVHYNFQRRFERGKLLYNFIPVPNYTCTVYSRIISTNSVDSDCVCGGSHPTSRGPSATLFHRLQCRHLRRIPGHRAGRSGGRCILPHLLWMLCSPL